MKPLNPWNTNWNNLLKQLNNHHRIMKTILLLALLATACSPNVATQISDSEYVHATVISEEPITEGGPFHWRYTYGTEDGKRLEFVSAGRKDAPIGACRRVNPRRAKRVY